jgi:hypothetical protein
MDLKSRWATFFVYLRVRANCVLVFSWTSLVQCVPSSVVGFIRRQCNGARPSPGANDMTVWKESHTDRVDHVPESREGGAEIRGGGGGG